MITWNLNGENCQLRRVVQLNGTSPEDTSWGDHRIMKLYVEK
jgi:hypothetical protein